MKQIRNKLSLAACGLLSQGAHAAEAIDNAWDVDSSLLYYGEADDRVAVTKVVLSVKGKITSNDDAALKAVFDTMAGATPSGAVKQSNLTFSGASGGGISASGQSTALAEFDDTRAAMSFDWIHAHSRTFSTAYNGAASVENDYRSFSVAATAHKETSTKAYKFSAGVAATLDQIFRVGGNDTPVPLSRVENDLSFGEAERDTLDLILGVTHVINQRTVAQLNFTDGTSQGYHTDPYKVFSIADALGNELDQYYESRPSSRRRNTVMFNLNHQLYPNNDVLHFTYRYYYDNWDVNSHTLIYSHKLLFSKARSLEPSIRLYTQTKAYFYNNFIFKDPADPTPTPSILPQFVSADYRLDDMSSATIGATYGQKTSADGYFRARLAYMYQSFDASEFDTNKAIIAQVSFNKRF